MIELDLGEDEIKTNNYINLNYDKNTNIILLKNLLFLVLLFIAVFIPFDNVFIVQLPEPFGSHTVDLSEIIL